MTSLRMTAAPEAAIKPVTRSRWTKALLYLQSEERMHQGSRFLKDPLFLASSVFVKKPERIIALRFIKVLCPLVYRLSEVRLRSRLVETQQTIPDQVHKPTARPTMRLSSFNALKALSYSTSRPLRLPTFSFYVFNHFTGSCYNS